MPAAILPSPMQSERAFSFATAIAVGVAAAAMVATLPGRTHGLGLVTEPLLADLNLGRVPFATLNLWATLIGAAFCLPVGWLVDRMGVRPVLACVLMALGLTVISMTAITTQSRQIALLVPELSSGGLESVNVPLDLFVLVLLTRGLGQSALSVVSLALVGKATGERPGTVIGVYSFLVAVGFMAAYALVKTAFETWQADWRQVWAAIGCGLIAFAAISLTLVKNVAKKSVSRSQAGSKDSRSFTLLAALLTPGFWVFALATSFYGLVAAGMSLFNQSLLAERGFDRSVFLNITTITPIIGLGANLISGWLATRIWLGVLLAAGLLIQMSALAMFPAISSPAHVYAYATAMGVSGGVLTVVFFTVWRQAFGPDHLGQIQGAAQLLTVIASAVGPFVLAAGHRALGSYAPVVQNLAFVSGALALAALIVPLPSVSSSKKESFA